MDIIDIMDIVDIMDLIDIMDINDIMDIIIIYLQKCSRSDKIADQ